MRLLPQLPPLTPRPTNKYSALTFRLPERAAGSRLLTFLRPQALLPSHLRQPLSSHPLRHHHTSQSRRAVFAIPLQQRIQMASKFREPRKLRCLLSQTCEKISQRKGGWLCSRPRKCNRKLPVLNRKTRTLFSDARLSDVIKDNNVEHGNDMFMKSK